MTRLVIDDFIGKVYKTNNSGDCFIIDIKDSTNITVMFYDGYIAKVNKGNLDKGKVKNPYYISNLVRGVGLFDSTCANATQEKRKVAERWNNMIARCYSDKFHERQGTYADVEVCEDWLMFSNFERDIKGLQGYDGFLKFGWSLDKDLVTLGGKLYSKETCCFIPQSLNSKIKSIIDTINGDVRFSKTKHNRFRVVCGGKHIGCFFERGGCFASLH